MIYIAEIITYGKITNEYDMAINRGNVKIITTHIIIMTKRPIRRFTVPYSQIGVTIIGTITGRQFTCTSSINTAINESLKNANKCGLNSKTIP